LFLDDVAQLNRTTLLILAAAGLSHEMFGQRLIPIGTVYDTFVMRGLDALNYVCCQNARFMVFRKPSGVRLAPEGGAHQPIGTRLIAMWPGGFIALSRGDALSLT